MLPVWFHQRAVKLSTFPLPRYFCLLWLPDMWLRVQNCVCVPFQQQQQQLRVSVMTVRNKGDHTHTQVEGNILRNAFACISSPLLSFVSIPFFFQLNVFSLFFPSQKANLKSFFLFFFFPLFFLFSLFLTCLYKHPIPPSLLAKANMLVN